MRASQLSAAVALVALALMFWPSTAAAQVRGRREEPQAGVYKARVNPHWFHGNTRFWYRNALPGGAREFIVVDAEAGTRRPAFDHGRLAKSLSQAAGKEYDADRLPFESIEFVEDAKAIRFRA